MIIPIIYIGYANESIPLGYMKLISRNKPIEMDTVLQLKALSFEMVDKIQNSNTMLINKKENITNISNSGLLLQIEDSELKRFLLHQAGFSFDVIFKLQQPITVSSRIIHTTILPNDGPLLIGTQILGHSSRKNEIMRYHDLVRALPNR